MRDMMTRVRDIQARRFQDIDGIDCSARTPEGLFQRLCPMDPSAESL